MRVVGTSEVDKQIEGTADNMQYVLDFVLCNDDLQTNKSSVFI